MSRYSLEARIALLEHEVARLKHQAGSQFALARSSLDPDDSGAVQKVQAQLDTLSTRDGIPILYHYGYFCRPPAGSDMHVAFVGGDRSQAVVVATNHQSHRFTGAGAGDAGLFALGLTIHLSSAGITMTDASGSTIVMSNDHKVSINSQQLTFNGQQVTLNASIGMTIQTPILSISQEVDIGTGPLKVNGVTVIVP